MYGFDAESALPLEGVVLSDNITTVSASQDAGPDKPGINEAIAAVNDSREEKIPFSAAEIKIESVPEECVYVSIDDIGVKHQKDSRKEGSVEPLILVFDEFKKEFDERFGSNMHIIDWSLHMDEATPHIHERHVFDATNRYGEIEPKQETALEELGFELPDPEKRDQRQITARLFLILPAGQYF